MRLNRLARTPPELNQMSAIYVDADACPVKDEVMRVVRRHELVVHMVSNQWMRLDDDPLVHRVVVEQGPDIADDWIADKATPGDVVITNDIPLASRCLDKGARVLGQKGRELSMQSIGEALASRELFQNLREVGVMTGGPKPMEQKDRSRFLGKLDDIVVAFDREA